jgi:hypothetical protein
MRFQRLCQTSITANDIAFRLLHVSKTQMDRELVRTTKMNLRRKKRTLTVNQTLSRNFPLEFLPEKAAGLDGIYPEFIKNFGAQTEEKITHAANKQLDVMFNGTSIKHVDIFRDRI